MFGNVENRPPGLLNPNQVNNSSGTLNNKHGGTGQDTSAAANGTLLIGNGSGMTLTTLTAGANVTITNGAGSISIASSASGTTTPDYVSYTYFGGV